MSLRWLAALMALPFVVSCQSTKSQNTATANGTTPAFLTNMRQLTFSGARTGEGYFSADGKKMIFQSERDADNPFYQIFLTDFKTNKTHRVSNGIGKTTCAWIHPNGKSVIYSSTHEDPQAKAKQHAELDDRAKGVTKMYAWDYDEHYDIYSASVDGKNVKNLTRTLGYDAEASISPNGKWIVFASNREQYSRPLTDDEKKLLAKDPAYFMDLYIMNVDGTQVRRLTHSPGYDGGPFFSPDSKRVVWRRFGQDGKAEVYTMNVDGTDEKQITRLNAMSWAPFYHPSGDYIIFTTNLHGYNNFELYIVDANGTKEPVRVTYQDGFDGLPVFKPNGRELTWNRKLADGTSQIFIADWNDDLARQALGLPGKLSTSTTRTEITDTSDLKEYVKYLASAEMRGRATGSAEEAIYTQQLAEKFSSFGHRPLRGDSFIQEFPFTKEAKLGSNNNLTLVAGSQTVQKPLVINEDWVPLAFSKNGEIPVTELVFAGYGIVAPADGTQKGYDSYAGLDVKDKWVVVFRYLPQDISPERKTYLQRYSKLEHKAMIARNLGARGLIVVSGPRSQAKKDLVPFKMLSGTGEMSLAVISISDRLAKDIFERAGKSLAQVQKEFDDGEVREGFALAGTKFTAKIDIRPVTAKGRNVLAYLNVGAPHTLVIGAHGDHLGTGQSESSLMRSGDKSDIHFGADDNASGVAAVLKIASELSKPENKKQLRQNILFAIWSGEELGNLGSNYFMAQITPRTNRKYTPIKLSVSAYINLDMVGRLKSENGSLSQVTIQGIGSSERWAQIIESVQKPLAVTTQQDPYLPTDAMAFYINKIPAINFFSGVHDDYHSPRDTAEKINYEGLAAVSELAKNMALAIATQNQKLPHKQVDQKSTPMRGGFRVSLGTIPDYASEGIKGVKLNGVVKGGPGEKAGLRAGDIIVEFAKMKIENINDYVFSLQSATPNIPTTIVVERGGVREEIAITPQSKE